jgi:hypothetical protein
MGGGRRDRIRKYPYRLTILILSRGDRLFRAEMLRRTAALALGEIIWVEGPEVSYDLEALSREFPDVRFLLIKAPATTGEMIDIGIAEAAAPLVLTLWSDTRIGSLTPSLLEDVESSAVLCAVPVIRNPRGEAVPSFQSPILKRGRVTLAFRAPDKDGERVLLPFDYCGIYNREKFTQAGGYDPGIMNPYWQKLDFGFRAHLWGERIQGALGFTISYTGTPGSEDATPDVGYKAFYLKNVAVRFRREMGILPLWRLFEYVMRSNEGPLAAVREFRLMREWVSLHRYRFRADPRELVARWGTGSA